MNEKYLFITGCARSGTTALTRLIGTHKEIILGLERFGHLIQPEHFSLTSAHFEKNRFFNVELGDTFYTDFDMYHTWDPNIRTKYGNHQYIGDKRPDLFKVYNELDRVFGKSATILFIYRNIIDVAASWNKRVEEGADHWPASKDFKNALINWASSLRKTLEAIDKGMQIICISYEDIFQSEKNLKPLFDKLELSIDRDLQQYITGLRAYSKILETDRQKYPLSESQMEYINKHAEFELEKKISDLSLDFGYF